MSCADYHIFINLAPPWSCRKTKVADGVVIKGAVEIEADCLEWIGKLNALFLRPGFG